jgi:hypothetical protein
MLMLSRSRLRSASYSVVAVHMPKLHASAIKVVRLSSEQTTSNSRCTC